MTKQDRINELREMISELQAEKKALDFVMVDRELQIEELKRLNGEKHKKLLNTEKWLVATTETLEELRNSSYKGADKDVYEKRIESLSEENEDLKDEVETLKMFNNGLEVSIESLKRKAENYWPPIPPAPVEVVSRAEVRGMVKTIVREELADMVDRLLEK